MKRKDLLAIAACDDRRFETLMQRDQLTFPSKGRWADYSLSQAFELRLTLDLIGGPGGLADVGVAPSLASQVITNALFTARGKGLRHPLNADGSDIWLGVSIIEEGPAEDRYRFSKWFAGPVAELPAFIAKAEAEEAGADAVRIIIVNASKAARSVRRIAAELEVPEALDNSEIWPQ